MILVNGRDQNEVRAESAESSDGRRGEHGSGPIVGSQAYLPIIVAGDDSTHGAQPEPPPMCIFGGIERAAVERRTVQRVAKISECGCPRSRARAFDAGAGIEVIEIAIRVNMV